MLKEKDIINFQKKIGEIEKKLTEFMKFEQEN